MKSVTVADIRRLNGRVQITKANKCGYLYESVQQAQAILEDAERAITDEVIILLAARKIGLANIEQLRDKRITLRLEVDINDRS